MIDIFPVECFLCTRNHDKIKPMKSFVLTISATLLVILSVNAQISINRTDFPAIGDLVVTAMDDINTINPGQPGPNKTWEFVNLVPTVYDSTYYISPVGAPGYQNYPDANIVTNHNPNQYPNGYNINYWNFSEANMKGIADESQFGFRSILVQLFLYELDI